MTSFLAIKGKTTNISNETKHEQITADNLKKSNCYYEIVRPNHPQRCFIDLDGKFEGNGSDFIMLNKAIEVALLSYEPLAGVRTSSMYEARSYRWNHEKKTNELWKTENKLSFIITYKKMTADVLTMKNWIINEELPRLTTLLQGIIPISTKSTVNELNVDTGVYSHHKVRCPNAWKEQEQKERISQVLKGTIEENLIQNIENCEMIETVKEAETEPEITIKEDKPKPKLKKNQVIELEDNEEKQPMTITPIIKQVCENIPTEKWTDYNEWLKILFIWKNENWTYEDFDTFSKKFGGDKYDKNYNKILWDKTIKRKGLSQATLWAWLKETNLQLFKSLQPKREDFYKLIIEGDSNLDFAELFYNLQPTKYAFSQKSKWWEYNQYNLLVNTGEEQPTGLKNNVAGSLRDYFNEQRKYLDMNDKDYEKRNNAINMLYKKLGSSSFCKGIIEFLPSLYLNNKIEDLVDSNTNIIAFENCLYDITKNEVRAIEPNDYISKTCGYDFINKSNPEIRKELNKVFESIFPDVDTREYYKKVIALSFFFNRFESFYVLTGKGRNGKGVLDKVIKKALGKYHYTADPTFLTSIIKSGVANPTLADCKGVRYLSVSEPDTGAENCCLNVEFVKGLTGRDDITTRNLHEKNKTFENHFSVFLQCNNRPTLNKLDKAIVERLKVIPFTERFISNPDPTDPHQHTGDEKLKDRLQEQKYINEFMLYMFEIAYTNKDIKGSELKVSELCNESKNEYVEENNAFKFWFDTNYKKIVIPSNFKSLPKEEREKFIVRTKTSTILAEYNSDKPKNEQITAKKLRNAMTFNDIEIETYNGSSVIKGYEKVEEKEPNLIDDLDK